VVASIGLRLDPLTGYDAWRLAVRRDGVVPWFLVAESVAVERRYLPDSNPLTVGPVTKRVAELGYPVKSVPFHKGGIAVKWQGVPLGFDTELDPVSNLFAQARMYTFLAYRDGFAAALESNAYTAERAVHAYIRMAVAWTERWPGLTLATGAERAQESAELRRLIASTRPGTARSGSPDPGQIRLSRVQQYQATLALPRILENDLSDLIAAYERAEKTPTGSRTSSVENDACMVIAQQLVGHIRLAALELVKDPSLHILSAYNIVRATANESLGGALARARLSAGDYALTALDSTFRDELLNGEWGKLTPEEQDIRIEERPVWGLLLGKPASESEHRS
jgi:hypothetical protein